MMLFATDWMTVVPPKSDGKEYIKTFVQGDERKLRSGFKYSIGAFDFVVASTYLVEEQRFDNSKIGIRYNF